MYRRTTLVIEALILVFECVYFDSGINYGETVFKISYFFNK